MGLLRILNNRKQVDNWDNPMEIVRHHRSSYDSRMRLYDFIAIACCEAETIIRTRLKSYDCLTTMAQHREQGVQVRTCANMVRIAATSHDVARRRAITVRCLLHRESNPDFGT